MIVHNGNASYRYRVGRMLYASEGDEISDPYAHLEDVREFKTYDGASAYRDRLVTETGRPALLQVGVVQWLSDDEAGEQLMELQKSGARPQ